MRFHKSNLFRIFLILFILFMLSFLAYYNVWLKANQTVTVSAPKNYVFPKAGSPLKTVQEVAGTVDIVTYGNGLTINSLFDISPTLSNETVIGHVYVEKLLGNSHYTHLREITVNNNSGVSSENYHLPAGSYRIVAFEDLYFTGYNHSMISIVLSEQPGANGTVVSVMPFPQAIFITMTVTGILSLIALSYAVIKNERHFLEG